MSDTTAAGYPETPDGDEIDLKSASGADQGNATDQVFGDADDDEDDDEDGTPDH